MQGVNTWLEQRPERIHNTSLMHTRRHKKVLKAHVVSLSLQQSFSSIRSKKIQKNLDIVDRDHSQVQY